MEITVLRLFCDLVDSGSFTRAAERNFLSQSAVSQRIRALEKNMGHRLLERGQGRGRAEPTAAGRVLYDGAKAILIDCTDLETRVRGIADEVSGTVKVATVYSVGLHALPGRLKPFLAENPKVHVRLEYSQTGKIYLDVLSGAVDVGIVACPSKRAGIQVVPFGVEEMVVVCAPEQALAAMEKVALSELEALPFIAFAEGIPTRRLTDERFRAAGVHPRIEMEFDNIETIKNLVEIGSGVALLPETAVRQEVREGTLAFVRITESERFTRPSGILLKTAKFRPAPVREFVESMREDTTLTSPAKPPKTDGSNSHGRPPET